MYVLMVFAAFAGDDERFILSYLSGGSKFFVQGMARSRVKPIKRSISGAPVWVREKDSR